MARADVQRDVVRRWKNRVFSHAIWTILQQVLGLASGILVVRAMGRDEYALFVITFGILTSVGSLADAGVLASLMRNGATQVGDRVRLAEVVTQSSRFRNRVNAVAAVAFTPFSLVLLLRAGADRSDALLLTILAVTGSFLTAASTINISVLRLLYRFGAAGIVLFSSTLIRTAIVAFEILAGSTLTASRWVALVVFVSIFEVALGRFLLRLPRSPKAHDHLLAAELVTNAWRQLPNSLFFVVQGQFLFTCLAFFGSTRSIAAVAALGRFSVVFLAGSSLFSAVSGPVFGRAQGVSRLRRIAVASILTYLVLAVTGLGAVFLARTFLLASLGPSYAGLEKELMLVSAGGALTGLAMILGFLNEARAWLRRSWLFVPLSIIWTIVLVVTIGFDSLKSSALFSALTPVALVVSLGYCTVLGFRDTAGASESFHSKDH